MAGLEHPTLAVAAVAAGAAGAMYLHLGRALGRRPAAQPRTRLALRMFALWWLATGVNILLGATFMAAASVGATSTSLQVAYAVLQRILLAASLVGLLHYLLVLVRGRAPLASLAVAYGLYAMVLVATLHAGRPDGVYVGQWRTDVHYAEEDAVPAWLTAVLGAYLIFPPVLLSLTTVMMARRLGKGQAGQRNRVTIVGTALALWWVVAVLAGQRETFGFQGYQLFSRLLGLSMALAIYAAYQPPAWLARRVALGPAGAQGGPGP
jgi:hypothetical protein